MKEPNLRQTPDPLLAPTASRCALFDFDGTLTKRSTVAPFVRAAAPWGALAKSMAALSPAVAGHLLGRVTFEIALARCARVCFKGLERSRLAEAGEAVARQLERGGVWPAALSALEGHLERAEPVAIVTGGYGYVAEAWARLRGLPLTIFSSELLWDENDRVVDAGLVRVGAAKLAGREWANHQGLQVAAYGNSSGDWAMLEDANEAFWMDRRGKLAPWPGLGRR
jgi:phosphatidylglycerophosphatase C